MNKQELAKKAALCKTCWECQGKADYVYYNGNTGDIKAVICDTCTHIFEEVIRQWKEPNT